MTDRPTDADLTDWLNPDRGYEDDVVILATEVRRLRSLLDRAYPHVMPAPGTEELQAELELEVLARGLGDHTESSLGYVHLR